ncbi:glycosyltransferase family 2 protein [Jeotgalibacillus marinus]|uniref:Glycosyltransferase family 2 protein n=1 Tax=Jeotgalibacillus marinus TaxID=86667 RepID=A0ABV3Q1F8_9BACL
MLQENRVSVIVPIYKVEKYLDRCIKSILNQSYENLEIILVDDGSPDRCGKIADHYKTTDSRVKVIHKENGGLSEARNYGMKEVTGEYVTYVDSDDWIDEKMIETMMNTLNEYEADSVQSSFYYAYERHNLYDHRYYSREDSPVILNNQSLIRELVINERIKSFAWGKLFKTKLIRDIPFRKGVLFEDVYWAHEVMRKVEKFVLIHDPLYNYFQRDDSIVANYSLRNLDQIKGLKERHVFITENYNNLTEESHKAILKSCLIHYKLLLLNRRKDKSGVHRKEVQQYIKKNYSRFKKAVKDDKELTQQLTLFYYHPYMNLLYLGVKKGLRKTKLIAQPVGLQKIRKSEGVVIK